MPGPLLFTLYFVARFWYYLIVEIRLALAGRRP